MTVVAHGATKKADHRPHLEPRRLPVRRTQDVVEEPVLLVPHLFAAARAHVVHGGGDREEVTRKFLHVIFIYRVISRRSNASPASTGCRTPSGRSRRPVPGGRRSAAALRSRRRCCPVRGSRPRRTLRPLRSLRLAHHVKLSSNFWRDGLQEGHVPHTAAAPLIDVVDVEGGPGVHRRVDVHEVPLVRADLPAGVEVVPSASVGFAAWQSRGPPPRAGCSGRRGPTRRTRYSHLSGIERMSAFTM